MVGVIAAVVELWPPGTRHGEGIAVGEARVPVPKHGLARARPQVGVVRVGGGESAVWREVRGDEVLLVGSVQSHGCVDLAYYE